MTDSVYRIPFGNTPQTFTISLAGRQFILTNKWNEYADAWVIDIADGVTSLPIVAGIPLVTGADLLAQYGYLGIDGSLVVFTDGDENAIPTLANLGTESNLYYLVAV